MYRSKIVFSLINFWDYLAQFSSLLCSEGIEEAFKVMDADGSGKISKAEFKKCMIDNGITDEATIDELLSKADCDGDGQLSISELRTAVEQSQQ